MIAWVGSAKASLTRLTVSGAILGPTRLIADAIRTSPWSDSDIDPVAVTAGPTGKALISVIRTSGLYFRTFTEG